VAPAIKVQRSNRQRAQRGGRLFSDLERYEVLRRPKYERPALQAEFSGPHRAGLQAQTTHQVTNRSPKSRASLASPARGLPSLYHHSAIDARARTARAGVRKTDFVL
jgi:hypothetical protein